MIKNNKNIKGIFIGDFEHKLSQFADDTTIVLDGSPNSLKAALNTIEIFGSYSGLKMNCDKTKIIWIGKKKHSKDKLITSSQLIWGETEFDLLGLHFSVDLQKMIDYNFNKYIVQIHDIIKKWNRRYLTLLGKITIVKTYIISKFIHLFSTLPTPSVDFLKKFNNIIYNFMWDGKPDKISRQQLTRQIQDGGLKMINMTIFIKSLKLTWIRRILRSEITTPWVSLANIIIPNINIIFELGLQKIKRILPSIQNAFWHDTILAWSDFVNNCKHLDLADCLNTPIWDNPHISSIPLHIETWSKKGIRFIGDIVDENLNLMNLDIITNSYNVKRIDFLTYNRIKIGVKKMLNIFNDEFQSKKYVQPNIPFPLNYVIKHITPAKVLSLTNGIEILIYK